MPNMTNNTRFARLGRLGTLLAAVLLAAIPAWANLVLVSQSADRLGAITLDDAVLFGEVFVFFENTTPENQISGVEFYIDGKLKATDIMAPYDLVGGDASAAEPFDTRRDLKDLKDPDAPNTHTMQVIVNLTDGVSLDFDVQFFVDNTLTPLESSSALQVVSATADAASRRLTLTGFNLDRGLAKAYEPQVSLDLQPLDIQHFDERTLVATLPGAPLRGDHVVNVSTDGNLVPGLQDSDHVEFLLTFGATDVSCLGCVSPQDVSFSYAQGDTQGGKALAASLADVALTAGTANFATTSATAGDTDLLDGLDSTAFTLVGDTQALDSRMTANEGAITALESGVGVGVGGQSNPQQVALLRWYEANEAGNTFAVGDHPAGVTFDGANIWVANYFDNNVSKLRASDGMTLGTFAVGNGARGIAFDGANIWVANFFDNNVSKLRASDGVEAAGSPFAVGNQSSFVTFDGANIWVTNSLDNNVSKLRASDGVEAAGSPFAVGNSPFGVAFDGANIWVTNAVGDSVSKLRASDGMTLGTFAVGNFPLLLAFDGANIWVANRDDDTVSKLRASDGMTLGTFAVGNDASGVAFDGANIWVTNTLGDSVSKL